MKQCSFSHNVTIQHQFQQTLIFANVSIILHRKTTQIKIKHCIRS